MKEKTPKNAIIVFSIILLLTLNSIGTLGTSSTSNLENQEDDDTKKAKSIVLRLKSTSIIGTSQGLSTKTNILQTLLDDSFYNNVRVSNEIGNESYPSMIISGFNGVCTYEYTDSSELYSRIRIRTTDDYGENWSDPFYLEDFYDENQNEYIFKNVNVKSPSFTNQGIGRNNAFGALITPDNNSYLYEIDIPKIDDKNTWSAVLGDYTYLTSNDVFVGLMYNMEKPDVCGYPSNDYPWVISLISDANFTEESGTPDMIDSPFFILKDPDEPQNRIIILFPDIQNCANVSICNGKNSESEDLIYGVCEKTNNTFNELLFFYGKPYIWINEDELPLNNQTIKNSTNVINPKIYVYDEHVYIIGENESEKIILFHSSDYGETWEEPRLIIKNTAPVVNFTYNAEHLNVDFYDDSFDPDGYILSYFWEFGDGTNSTEQNPNHIYANSGTYPVKLTITDNMLDIFSVNKDIIISNTTPIADFIYNPTYPNIGSEVTFNSISTATIGYNIDNFTWDFGDGSIKKYSENVTHKYQNNGTYTVNLIVLDNKSETDYIEKIIYVGLVSEFTYSPIKPNVGEDIAFTNKSKIPTNHSIVSYYWDFGDGSTSTLENPIHNYSRAGYYNIKLEIKDNNNTIASTTHQILITPFDYTPRFLEISGNNGEIMITYTAKSNIFLATSNNNGNTWENPIILNSNKYSVTPGVGFSVNVKNTHIAWTDNRDFNNNIYSIIRASPSANLEMVVDSLSLDTEVRLLCSRNIIRFTVRNNGDFFVEDIPVNITVNFNNENYSSIHILSQTCVKQLAGNGAKRNYSLKLFEVGDYGFFQALIDYADIKEIYVTVDPEGISGDKNLDDNTKKLNVEYLDLFPKFFGRFESLFIILKDIRGG